MLDMKFVRENPDLVRGYLAKRRVQFPLDDLLELDSRRRKLIVELQDLRHKRNVCSDEVAALKAKKGDASKIISEMREAAKLFPGKTGKSGSKIVSPRCKEGIL